jgi:uncharacterized 2Fe-2S/4Fe-4S cluster protein (DUF4445 family)
LKSSEKLAIAFDIGTTTVAASLVDMENGKRLDRTGSLNPQREFGADVVLRLQAACESKENLQRMQLLINREMQRLSSELLSRSGMDYPDLSCVAVAGNPTMEHLVLGMPVTSLAFPPHRPLFRDGEVIRTTRVGWEADTKAYLFPLPGGFVGGDLVAFLYGLFSGETRARQDSPLQDIRLCLDLGTNAEIALVAKGRIFATSAAAGPAFEGGNLSCGMAAMTGAINKVGIAGDRVMFSTIGSGAPSGICGSGVLDAVSELLAAGVIDPTGRLLPSGEVPTNLGNRIDEINADPAFVIYRDASHLVYLSQRDIREVQLAKSAIRAGMEILFSHAGVSADDVRKVVLTGSFGSELAAGSLKSVGVLTEKMVHITDFVSDGVLAGVERALCCRDDFAGVAKLADAIRVVPLSGTPAFEKLFVEHMNFPKI